MAITIPTPKFLQRKLIAFFIDETGSVFKAKKAYAQNVFEVTIQGKKHTYIVKPEHVYNMGMKRMPTSFYHVGRSEPLDMRHERPASPVSAHTMNQIMKDDTLSQLFNMHAQKILTMLIILTVINILLGVVTLLVEFGLVKVNI